MLNIKGIWLRAHSSESGPDAEIIIEVETADGELLELGREKLPGAISSYWHLNNIDPKKLKKSELASGQRE